MLAALCCHCNKASRSAAVTDEITKEGFGLGLLYTTILEYSGHVLAQAVQVLADPTNYPVLIHCLHGKDRTGLLVALVLLCCGVSQEQVIQDYALSGPLLAAADREHKLDEFMLDWVRTERMLASPESALQDALDWLQQQHGGTVQQAAVRYLECHGANLGVITRLRAILCYQPDTADQGPDASHHPI